MTAVLRPSALVRSPAAKRAIAATGGTIVPLTPPLKSRRDKQRLSYLPPPVPPSAATSVVRTLPTARKLPLWLKVLVVIQQSSSIITFGTVASVLIIYGWTVHAQQQWGQEYRRLDYYQRQERQLMTANEVLKNEMAKQAENPTTGLVMPSSATITFVQPVLPRPAPVAIAPVPSSPPPSVPGPIGY